MALLRFAVKYQSRASGGAPTARHVAYVIREQEYAPTRVHVEATMRASAVAGRCEDLVHAAWGNLPGWAQGNPVKFFEAADAYERRNARMSTTMEVALPRELSRSQQIALVEDFCASQVPRHPYAVGVHESRASDGLPQPHFHLVYSERITDGLERSPAQHFRRYNQAHPECGGAQKDRQMQQWGLIAAQRQAWSDLMNWHLEQAGQTVRVDPRSLKEQGISRKPEPPLPSFHTAQLKYRGAPTPAWEGILATRTVTAPLREAELSLAQAAWEARTQDLGLTPTMTRAEVVQVITARMHHDLAHRRDRSQVQSPARGADEQRTLQTHVARLRGEIMRHEQYERMGKTPTPAMRSQAQRLLHQSVALGLGSQADDQARVRRGLTMDLQQDKGYGYGD